MDDAEQEDEDETEGEGELLKSEVGFIGFVLTVLLDPLTFTDKKLPLLASFFNEKLLTLLLVCMDKGGEGDLLELVVLLLIPKPDCFRPPLELQFPGGLWNPLLL